MVSPDSVNGKTTAGAATASGANSGSAGSAGSAGAKEPSDEAGTVPIAAVVPPRGKTRCAEAGQLGRGHHQTVRWGRACRVRRCDRRGRGRRKRVAACIHVVQAGQPGGGAHRLRGGRAGRRGGLAGSRCRAIRGCADRCGSGRGVGARGRCRIGDHDRRQILALKAEG